MSPEEYARDFVERLFPFESNSDRLDALYDTVDELMLQRSDENDQRIRSIFSLFTKYVEMFRLSVYTSLLAVTRPWRPLFYHEREILIAALHTRVTRESGTEVADEDLENIKLFDRWAII